MKKLLSFGEFINESQLNEKALNAKQASKEGLFTADEYIKEKQGDDDDIANVTKKACDLLGELPTKVFGIDQYAEDTDDLVDTYEKIKQSFRGTEVKIGGKTDYVSHDKKMGVVMVGNTVDDFEIYWFTSNSKF
jgi:hypothetical protein